MGITMARNTTYQLRLDETLKQESFSVFHELGITPAEGMRIFLTMVAKTKSIPFAVNVPNAETQQVFEETDAGINLNKAESVPDLFKQLGI
jgi:DNA-damage-inducible protein J